MIDTHVTLYYIAIMTGGDLKRIRDHLAMTQEELAKRLGVTRATVNRWEQERVDIPEVVELAIKEVQRQESR